MQIHNIHERILHCAAEKAKILIDSFANKDAPLWPTKQWPRDHFDSPLQLGTIGGHGGTKYFLKEYITGKYLHFEFTYPKNYMGNHTFTLTHLDPNTCLLQHSVTLKLKRLDTLWWYIVIEPVHNALIENAFDNAEKFLQLSQQPKQRWPLRVYFIRHYLGCLRLVIQSMKSINKNLLKMILGN